MTDLRAIETILHALDAARLEVRRLEAQATTQCNAYSRAEGYLVPLRESEIRRRIAELPRLRIMKRRAA